MLFCTQKTFSVLSAVVQYKGYLLVWIKPKRIIEIMIVYWQNTIVVPFLCMNLPKVYREVTREAQFLI